MDPKHRRILDHYQNPRCKAKIGSAKNSCGDSVTIMYHDQYIWSGTGCAYSMAAASMMCECLNNGMDIGEDDMLMLFGEVPENRKDCVLVAYHALQDALQDALR